MAAERWGWQCLECGRRFRSAAAAERAALGDEGCPGCGGNDIDFAPLAQPVEDDLSEADLARIRRAEAETAAYLEGR